MNKLPLVSVIIPNYCHAQYLNQRIASVLNQTYDNFEVIILDDCSQDNGASKEIIENYRSNPHITQIVYNNTNSGSTFIQWDKGIKLAKGELIWIAESDDYCEHSFIEELIKPFIDNDNLSFAYCDFIMVDKKGKTMIELNKGQYHNVPATTPVYDGRHFIKERMISYCSVCNASAVIFRKKYALNISTDYIKYKACGDYLFWIMMAEMGEVAKIDKPLDFFRQHDSNITSKSIINGTNAIENYQILKYLSKNGFLNGKEGLRCFLYLLEKQMSNPLYSKEVKRKVLNVWNPYHIFNKYTMALCWRITKK